MRLLTAILLLLLILTVGCGPGYHDHPISVDAPISPDIPDDDDEPILDDDAIIVGDECDMRHNRLCCPVLNRHNEVKIRCSKPSKEDL